MTLPEGFQNKSFYSCCDLVNFSPFAKWILSADDSSDRTRTNFVALIIHLAFNLYNLDPETHIKALVNNFNSANVDSAQVSVSENSDANNSVLIDDIEILPPGDGEKKANDETVTATKETDLVEGKSVTPEKSKKSVEHSEEKVVSDVKKDPSPNKNINNSASSKLWRIKPIHEINNVVNQEDEIEIIQVETKTKSSKANEVADQMPNKEGATKEDKESNEDRVNFIPTKEDRAKEDRVNFIPGSEKKNVPSPESISNTLSIIVKNALSDASASASSSKTKSPHSISEPHFRINDVTISPANISRKVVS